MDREHVFDQDLHYRQNADERQLPRTVVVELSCNGTARIREAPPDVLVMVAHSKEISVNGGSRSIAAGGRGDFLASGDGAEKKRPTPFQIPVSFPG